MHALRDEFVGLAVVKRTELSDLSDARVSYFVGLVLQSEMGTMHRTAPRKNL